MMSKSKESSNDWYQERVLLDTQTSRQDSTALRFESLSSWDVNSMHPFRHLDSLFSVIGDEDVIDISIQVSSGAIQRLSSNGLPLVPILATNLSFPSGPSGFWISIRSPHKASDSSSSLTMEKVEKYVGHWVKEKLITTPLLSDEANLSWDIIMTGDSTVFQLFLPANGDAWSADALYQSFQTSLGCNHKDFLGRSPTEWSNLLVEGEIWDKILWWKIASSNHQRQVSVGMQFEQSRNSAAEFLSALEAQSPEYSCLLGKRSILYIQPRNDTLSWVRYPSAELLPTPPEESQDEQASQTMLSADLVIRRPWPQKGRLETWISAEPTYDCSLMIRQVLPPFLTPSWQSLDVTIGSHDENEIASNPMKPFVEWKEDGSSILTLSSTQVPSSVVISLDYNPNFLTYDDFSGDPNRGKDLPPVVVTVTCSNESFQVFSNSPLILPPVPDMSMPFNVLSLACSLYAYLIGTLVTLMIKRASEKIVYKLHPEKEPKSKLKKLKERIKSKLQKRTQESKEEEKMSQ